MLACPKVRKFLLGLAEHNKGYPSISQTYSAHVAFTAVAEGSFEVDGDVFELGHYNLPPANFITVIFLRQFSLILFSSKIAYSEHYFHFPMHPRS